MATDNRNFDQKIFWFPEAYNELRREMMLYWPDLWKRVQWQMAFDAEWFVELMNKELDGVFNVLLATNDKQREIGYICNIFLTELRRRRGEAKP